VFYRSRQSIARRTTIHYDPCVTQDELDHFWNKLSEGGEEGVCGWLKDKFGLSWQIVPSALPEMMRDPDSNKSQRVTRALMQMKRLDIAALQRAYGGT
jgi:predicted 3-demethylubiquinone-9 3-methyltransferase (glyoxalase superfamily)